MPIFEYQCTKCGCRYEVLHLGAEKVSDVVCPDCKATTYRRLISAPSVLMGSHGSMQCSPDNCDNPSGCCGGACSAGH
jgi:putative FmdB family regulatory protein